jgi:hypothetical protein
MYASYNDLGRFKLIAAEGDFPSLNSLTTVESKSLNDLTQILELGPPNSPNSSYFILIEGEKDTKFNFTVKPI